MILETQYVVVMVNLLLHRIEFAKEFARLAKHELYGLDKEIDWSCVILKGLKLHSEDINPTDMSCFSVSPFSCMTSTFGTVAPSSELLSTSLTLLASGWIGNVQTLSLSGIVSDSLVWISPKPEDANNYSNYLDAEIYLSGKTTGMLEFTCGLLPTEDIVINVIYRK